jgi:hypothetical protein
MEDKSYHHYTHSNSALGELINLLELKHKSSSTFLKNAEKEGLLGRFLHGLP